MFVEAGTDPPPDGFDLDALEAEIGRLAAEINSATCRWLLLIAEFERRRGHERAGFTTIAGWVAWRCGVTGRAAREQTRVARSLGELSSIRERFAAGGLSYSKVRALTRVATTENEIDLLELAEHATAAQLERVLSGYRFAQDGDGELLLERRSASYHWERDGTLTVRVRLLPDEGARYLRALAHCRELEPGSCNADGVVRMSELALSATASGAATASAAERNQVVVHVDLAEHGGDGEGGPAQLEDGPSIPGASARRLSCDASVVTLLERGGEPVSVGRRTRSVPPSLARALRSRDRRCRFPGCENHRFVDAHHVQHWAAGGETSLENLVLLCRRHHRLVHEGGWSVSMKDGEPRFRRPGGAPVATDPMAGVRREQRGLPAVAAHVSAGPAPPEPLDLDHAVFVLAARDGP